MPLHGRAEAIKVVAQKKTLDECISVAQPSVDIPRRGNRHKDKPRPDIAQCFLQQTGAGSADLPQQQYRSGNQHRYWTLGEDTQGHPQGGASQSTAVICRNIPPQIQRRQHQPQAKQRICGGRACHGPRPQAAGKHHGSQHRGSRPPSLVGGQGQRHTRQPCRQRGGQSQSEFIQPQKRNAQCLQPVHAYGFVKPVRTIQGGVAPVATDHHFTGCFGKCALIHIEQQALAKAQ